jgi:methylphosphotriester-DNA--protein-cysteine methyltransferase
VYTLIRRDGKPHASDRKGTFGGHRKQRIYGRLDCASALRHVAAGTYAKNCVFFADEATAIAAGYRPCARCMPHEYAVWKNASRQ